MAHNLSALTQSATPPEGLTVQELASYGRYQYKKRFKPFPREDDKNIADAIYFMDLNEYKNTDVSELSCGQIQHARIAMCMAQNTDIIILDEPTTFLDLSFKTEVLKDIKKISDSSHKTVITVLHDLSQASFLVDNIIVMKKGKLLKLAHPMKL